MKVYQKILQNLQKAIIATGVFLQIVELSGNKLNEIQRI
jgi:hypothetical protein